MNRKVGVVFSYILIVVEVVCSFFFSPLIIKSLGTSAYGVYKLALSISSYATLLDLGIGQASIKYLTKFRIDKDSKKRDEFFTISFIFYLIVSSVIIIIAILFSSKLVLVFSNGLTTKEIALAGKLVLIAFLTVAVNMGTAIFYNAILAYEMFALNKICAIIQILLKTTLCVFVLLTGHGALEVMVAEFFATLFIRTIMIIIVFTKTEIRFNKTINFALIKETISFSTFVMIQMIALQITQVTDQIIIGIIVSEASYYIALYSLGSQIIGYFNSFSNAINGVIMPGVIKIAETKPDPKSIENEIVKVGRIVLITMGFVLCMFVAFGREFIGIWLGHDYYSSYDVGVILMIIWLLLAVVSVGSQMLWAFNLHKIQAIIAICVSVTNVGLTVAMVKWNPLIGAALSTSISLFLGNIVAMFVVLNRKVHIDILNYLKRLIHRVLFVIILVLCIGFGIKALIPCTNWFYLCLDCGLMLLIYFGLMLICGFNETEKKMVNSFTKKITKS